MKRPILRLLSGISALALLLALFVGCSNTAAPNTTDAASSAPSATDTEASTEPAVKWTGTISVSQYMHAPVENDVITPKVEEALLKYGYDVKLEIIYIENNQYSELINLRIASGDAPDIFKVDNDTQFTQWCQQDAIAVWDESFFREHAPTAAGFIDSGGSAGQSADIVGETWRMCKYNGKMACIPAMLSSTSAPLNVIYNKQWMDRLGAKVPETLDDFVALMYRFKNDDPDGNGSGGTYGFSTTMLNVIFGAYGGYPGFLYMDTLDYGHWYDVNGSLVAADIMPGNKDALSLIHKLYADGVLDPEFVTGENTGGYWAISHSFVNGRIGVTQQGAMNHYQPAEITGTAGAVLQEFQKIQGAEAQVVIGPWISGPNGDRGGFRRYANTVAGGNVYNSKLAADTEKLGAIFDIVDIFAQDLDLAKLSSVGIEGEHYTIQDGDWIKMTDGLDKAGENKIGIKALRGLFGPGGYPMNAAFEKLYTITPAQKWREEIEASYPGLASNVGYLSKLYTPLPSQTKYQTEIHTYRDEVWLKMIQGTLPIDYYDTYVEEWYNKGGRILTQEANDWYAKNK